MLYEYDLFIPIAGKDKAVKSVLERTRKSILAEFGGLTETRQSNKGLWKIGPLTVKDEIEVWHVLSEFGKKGDQFFRHLRKQLEHDLKQDLVLIIRHKVKQI